MTPEGRVKAWLKAAIEKEFPNAYRFMPVQNGMGAPALDFYYCIEGRFIAIETKVPGKNLTDRQYATALAIQEAGGCAYVVRNKDEIAYVIQSIHTITTNGDTP